MKIAQNRTIIIWLSSVVSYMCTTHGRSLAIITNVTIYTLQPRTVTRALTVRHLIKAARITSGWIYVNLNAPRRLVVPVCSVLVFLGYPGFAPCPVHGQRVLTRER